MTTWLRRAFGAQITVLTLALVAFTATNAMAQGEGAEEAAADSAVTTPAGTSRTGMDSVVVTGTKRDTEAQSVPISITAISNQQLANTFRTDIWAVADLAPNVTLTQMAGFRAVAGGIRGTGSNSILVTQDTSVPVIRT